MYFILTTTTGIEQPIKGKKMLFQLIKEWMYDPNFAPYTVTRITEIEYSNRWAKHRSRIKAYNAAIEAKYPELINQ